MPPISILSRRHFLHRAAIVGGSAGFALSSASAFAEPSVPGKIRLSWNANAVCLAPVALAVQKGLFEKYGVDVELVNFGGSTDQLLEALATGKSDIGVGMILRWLKPLEQNFDVKLIGGTHGGCSRMVGSKAAGVTDIQSLKGKTIGAADVNGVGRITFSILLRKNGIDPDKDVEWRAFPQPLLGAAVEKGEVQAIADGDPSLYLIQKRSNGDLVEILTNLTPPWDQRVCCVIGASGTLLRNNRPAATAVTRALLEAAQLTADHPEETAAAFQPYTPASVDDLVAVLKSQTHGAHPIGNDLKNQIVQYADEMKAIGVIKPSTDTTKFADRIFADVLTA